MENINLLKGLEGLRIKEIKLVNDTGRIAGDVGEIKGARITLENGETLDFISTVNTKEENELIVFVGINRIE